MNELGIEVELGGIMKGNERSETTLTKLETNIASLITDVGILNVADTLLLQAISLRAE